MHLGWKVALALGLLVTAWGVYVLVQAVMGNTGGTDVGIGFVYVMGGFITCMGVVVLLACALYRPRRN